MAEENRQNSSVITNAEIVNEEKEALARGFRLSVPEQNSLTEIFPKPILIALGDLTDLHRQIAEKLNREKIVAAEFIAVIGFEDKKHKEFKSWEDFSNAGWSIPDVTQSLILKWHFLIQFHNADKPAKHTITIRLASDPNPMHLLQTVFSRDPDEIDELEIISAPMSCRIDFADNVLSQELLNLVSQWNSGRRSPEISLPILKLVKKRRDYLNTLIVYSVPVMVFIAFVAFYWKEMSGMDLGLAATVGLIRNTVIWFILGTSSVFVSFRFAKWLGSYSLNHINRFGKFTIFEMTNGDSNRQTKLQAKTQNSIIKFTASATFALILNVVAGIITYWILSGE